jgi:hypothetical protein
MEELLTLFKNKASWTISYTHTHTHTYIYIYIYIYISVNKAIDPVATSTLRVIIIPKAIEAISDKMISQAV